MGLFSKERHGSLTVQKQGYRFLWKLPDAMALIKPMAVLDSDLATTYQGVEFHFHLIVGPRGDVGFYIHHKQEKIPKYSFRFAAGSSAMRQHTAHTIPQETERCGHWNVCSTEDVRGLLGEHKDLNIFFTFDDDFLDKEPHADGSQSVTWTVPTLVDRCISPFTSHSFTFNGVGYVLRLDEDGAEGYVVFVFSRTGLVPPHDLTVMDGNSDTVTQVPRTEDMSTQLVKFPRGAIAAGGNVLRVRVVMHRGGNPLDILNTPTPQKSGTAAAASDAPKESKYGVHMDDL